MNERLKRIRKDVGLSQKEFGETIGATRGMIAVFEIGRVVPSDPIIKLICSTYNVNEMWLKTGEGQPYGRQLVPELVKVLKDNPPLYDLMCSCMDRLTPQDWKTMADLVEKIVKKEDIP